jgi:hypothetical protein
VSQERQQNATWANVGERVAKFCADAEVLCRRIAPRDLGDTPLYVVPLSRINSILGGPSVCDGFTCPSLDLYLRHDIGSSWRGRGPCMVINDLQFDDEEPADVELALFATVLHELAHILERPRLFHERTNVEPARLLFEAIVLAAYVQDPPIENMPERMPLRDHGERFIRAALHLCHRAEAAGVCIGPALVCPNRDYGLSHANAYQAALGDEPVRLADAGIRDVLAGPPPEEFSRLWADDLTHWLSHHLSEKEKIA